MNLTIYNTPTYVLEQGSGRPVFCLHGHPDSADMWQGLFQVLAPAGYHCLAADLPGFGRSDTPAGFDLSLESMAGWVDEVVKALKLTQPLHLVVHDFGAHYGLAWAILHPEKVASLTISNTNFFSDYKWHWAAQILRVPLLGELALGSFTEFTFVKQMQSSSPNLPTAYLKQTYKLYTSSVKKMALRLYRTTNSSRFVGWEDKLRALNHTKPSCVVWGDQDPYAPVSLAERFEAQQVYHFPTGGHWVFVEQPTQVGQKLLAWWSTLP